MICPNCNKPLNENFKMCGAIKVYYCDLCTFERAEHTNQMNIGLLHDWSLKEAHFRRIVKKAMITEGLEKQEQQEEFIEWLIGEDYRDLPYMIFNRAEIEKRLKEEGKPGEIIDDWLTRIKKRLRNVSGGASVFEVLRAGVREWRSKQIRAMVN